MGSWAGQTALKTGGLPTLPSCLASLEVALIPRGPFPWQDPVPARFLFVQKAFCQVGITLPQRWQWSDAHQSSSGSSAVGAQLSSEEKGTSPIPTAVSC